MTARYAIYYLPEPETSLWMFGTRVLGYDTYNSRHVPYFSELLSIAADWDRFVQQPVVYGFHATLKAPFRLAPGKTEEGLLKEVAATAASRPQVALGHLRVEAFGRFLALRPEAMSQDLNALESGLVTGFDEFRAPLGDQEKARRHPATLTVRQREKLDRWGYPFCLEEFRFHMTLSGPLQDGAREHVRAALSALYASFDEPAHIVDIAILKQSKPDLPFRVLQKFRLGVAEYGEHSNNEIDLSHR